MADTFIDYFLKVDGLDGGSTQVGHKGDFEIKDFSFGIENPTTIGSATGGAGAGKIKFNEFTIKKTTDQASPLFFRNCAAGAHYKKVTLAVRKAGGDPKNAGTDFLKVVFSDVLTSRYVNTGVQPAPPPPPVDVVVAPTDTVGDQIGGLTDVNGDGTPQDNISFRYAQLQESVNATRILVPAISSAVLAFDAATNTFKLNDAPGGVFTVGSMGGVVSRAAMEFNGLGILIGLLTAPFSTARLGLTINGFPPGPPVQPGDVAALSVAPSSNAGAEPHLFDVILYTPADGILTVEDLTRHGSRIGTLTFLDDGTPVTLDIDLTELIKKRHLDAFGIRIELRGAPIPGLNDDQDERDDPDVGHGGNGDNADQAHADGVNPDGEDNNKNDDKKRAPGGSFLQSFTVDLALTTG